MIKFALWMAIVCMLAVGGAMPPGYWPLSAVLGMLAALTNGVRDTLVKKDALEKAR